MESESCGLYDQTVITCPACGGRHTDSLADGSPAAWTCPACGAVIRVTAAACCIYCAHGTVPCRPAQRAGRSCCAGD